MHPRDTYCPECQTNIVLLVDALWDMLWEVPLRLARLVGKRGEGDTKGIAVAAELDEFEFELVASLFRDYIIENREMARVKHAAGKKTDDELKWHLGHADFVEAIAKKFFPSWRS